MESSRSQSFFQDIRSRELNGFRVRKRPYIATESSDFDQIGAVSVEHDGSNAPPMALSFCKTSKNSHILAVTDEDGYVSLFNTRLNFPSSSTYQQNAEKARVCDWVAHDNAIFDICWIKNSFEIPKRQIDNAPPPTTRALATIVELPRLVVARALVVGGGALSICLFGISNEFYNLFKQTSLEFLMKTTCNPNNGTSGR